MTLTPKKKKLFVSSIHFLLFFVHPHSVIFLRFKLKKEQKKKSPLRLSFRAPVATCEKETRRESSPSLMVRRGEGVEAYVVYECRHQRSQEGKKKNDIKNRKENH